MYSSSAEVQGHGPGQEVLQTGKRQVGRDDIQAVGQYAVQPRCSDGHDTGIFSCAQGVMRTGGHAQGVRS